MTGTQIAPGAPLAPRMGSADADGDASQTLRELLHLPPTADESAVQNGVLQTLAALRRKTMLRGLDAAPRQEMEQTRLTDAMRLWGFGYPANASTFAQDVAWAEFRGFVEVGTALPGTPLIRLTAAGRRQVSRQVKTETVRGIGMACQEVIRHLKAAASRGIRLKTLLGELEKEWPGETAQVSKAAVQSASEATGARRSAASSPCGGQRQTPDVISKGG